jgi:drug/metabolite transporter (DMT)-like permease
MNIDNRYKGIFFMLLAALGFSIMGGAAKSLKGSLNAGQLVFYRNLVGILLLTISFKNRPPVNKGGKFRLLIFRGLMGTIALYTLMYCVLHIPLGTAMSYNLTSAIFIALFSFLFFKEYDGKKVITAIGIGFIGMLLIYKPAMHFSWVYHAAGLISVITSALAYLAVGRLNPYYDLRIIVLAFVGTGLLVPSLFMLITKIFNLPIDDVFFIEFKWPVGIEWFQIFLLGFAALFGQYFVTKAYGADRAAVVSSVSYTNIIFSVFIGIMLGDAFPDLMSWIGIFCIISSGIIISFIKRHSVNK